MTRSRGPRSRAQNEAAPLPVALAPGVRTRLSRDGLLVLAPDGVTALVFDADDLAVLDGPDTAMRRALIGELDHCGIRAGSTPAGRTGRGVHLSRRGLEVLGLDRIARLAYRRVGPRTRRLAMVAVGLASAFAVVELARGGVDMSATKAGLGPLAAAAMLFVIGSVLAVVHELGHALVLISRGGRIGSAGFGFHWGAPSFYVDSTAALFLPRRQRIGQAAAGVLAELTTAAVVVLVAAVVGSPIASYAAGAAVTYALASAIVNGAPVLGLDGALIISDLMDRPTLPGGASVHTSRLGGWVRLLDLVVGVAALGASFWIWTVLWWDLLGPLWAAGLTGRLAVVLTALPTAAASVVGLAGLTAESRPAA